MSCTAARRTFGFMFGKLSCRPSLYTVCQSVVSTDHSFSVCVVTQKSRPERRAVGSEGWEEGESDEERDGDERQKEEQGLMEEKVTSGEKEGAEKGEEEKKRKAQPSSSHLPAKKKTDDSKFHEL